MAKRKLKLYEMSPTQIADALNMSPSAISQLSHTDKRYITYRDAYLYRLILSTFSHEERVGVLAASVQPKVKDLVEYTGLSRQNFSALKKNNPELYSVYVDAWKYVFAFKKCLTAFE